MAACVEGVKLNALDSYRDAGLLLLCVGIGLSYVGYGAPKLFGGPPMWEELGQAMRSLGITFAPAVWRFLAAVSEFFGGIALVVGGLFRVATVFLVGTMIVRRFSTTDEGRRTGHTGSGRAARGGCTRR
jgi:putative oxidoreductase